MGYYSNFRMLTTTEGRKVLEDYLKKCTAEKDFSFFSYLDEDKTDKENGLSLFGCDDIKWYEDFPEVNNFINGMDYLKEKDIPYSFVRIGEELDDVEYQYHKIGEMPTYLCVKREFSTYGSNWE